MSKTKDATAPAPSRELTQAKGAKDGKEKPEVDREFEGLMSEIESDLRDEEFKKIWSRYGAAIITFAVALVLGVIVFQLWRQYEDRMRIEAATSYDQAEKELQAGQYDQALTGFKAVMGHRFAGGYKALAELGEAAAELGKKDEAGAIASYKALAADNDADPAFRDLATILEVQHSMDSADARTLEVALAPITTPKNPFRASALELSALLAAKEGDISRARQFIDQLLTDPTAPPGVRQRATDLAALYKDEAPLEPAKPEPVAPATAQPTPAKPPSKP